MLPEWLPWLLQVNDSQFPSGSYAHSMGLEELVQRGLVPKPDDVEKFLHQQVVPSLCAFELPFLAQAHAAATAHDIAELRRLDDELDAWKLAAELRQASRQIGSRRLTLTRKLEDSTLAAEYASTDAPCHHLIVCAIELKSLPVAAAACAYAQQTISGYATSAMKLVRMGQERCQLMVRGAITALAPKLEAAVELTPERRIGWFNPLLEIASMRHSRAHERLFIS
ncbi:urease accessory UreF family protein [Roseimicrobium sp. ORNL1]|uniref:urease accessory protein UreF n=1 Tax=Roseimicrobium sp. ORNL1 TaxID=2711231 RepID=UPI0013E146D2|nr:urease accessory UreF family protein [Roseimicrobium sp. ORNL1]QIF01254.1 urease accessory protein UreF [Roseimicrobium sp. ORNL1]